MNFLKQKSLLFVIFIAVASILILKEAVVENYTSKMTDPDTTANGQEALDLIQEQVSFGPRYPGSEGHKKVVEWLGTKLRDVSDENTKEQTWNQKGTKGTYDLTNFIFRINPDNPTRFIVGTHFDTLKKSIDGGHPIPGANNGGSGTAVMLTAIEELLKSQNDLKVGVDFVFFDAEEGDPDIPPGSSPDWSPWGSVEFVKHLDTFYPKQKPNHMINLDLVCSKDAKFYYEVNSFNSATSQTQEFWELGSAIDSEMFVKQKKYTILDDHIAFQKAGIPSFLVIDFDYPELHSTTDTLDKCSGETLEKVGGIVYEYITSLR